MKKRGGSRAPVSSWWGEDFGRAVSAAWKSGLDTNEIAKKLLVPEPVVYGLLASQGDRRHEARKQERAAS